MYDADYEEFLQEQNDRAIGVNVRGKYETKDSGKLFESPDGMVRDTSEGKPQFTLMFPKGIPFEDQLMTRVADLYHRGGVKYGPRNWEKSSTEEALAKHEDCLMRHVVKFLLGVDDGEDHAAAIVWNVNAVDLTRWKIKNTLPDGPELKSIDEFLEDPSKGVRRERYPTESEQAEIARADEKPFPKVEFADGDELLDKNNNWWAWSSDDRAWYCRELFAGISEVGELAKAYGPLYIQTGVYAGITVLKDGGITHDE
jgi:hypothetical protein